MRLLALCLFLCVASYAQDKTKTKNASVGENTFTEGMKLFVLEDYNKALLQFETFVKIEEKSAAGFYMKARTENALNQNIKAEISAETSVNLDRQNYYYLQNYADILKKNFKINQAEKTYKDLIKLNPDHVDAYFTLLEMQVADGKPSEALKTLEAAEKQFGSSDKITKAKQIILLRDNKIDAALKEGDKRLGEDPEFVLNQAKILVENKRQEEAVKMLEAAISQHSDFTDGFGMLSELYASLSKKDKSKELLDKILNTAYFPYSLKVNAIGNHLKLVSNDKNELSTLLSKIENLITIYPKEARGYIYNGDINYKLNKLGAARNSYAKAVGLDKNQFEVWLALVQLDFELAQFGKLEKDAENATMYFPNHAAFWFYLSLGNLKNNHLDDAEIALEEAARFANLSQLKAGIEGANYLLKQKQKKPEPTAFETLATYNPKDEWVQYLYIESNLLDNKIDKALPLAAKLTEQSSSNIAYRLLFAQVLVTAKRWEDALKALAFNQELDDNSYFYDLKGDALSGLGQMAEANIAWQKALELDPSNRIIKSKLKDL